MIGRGLMGCSLVRWALGSLVAERVEVGVRRFGFWDLEFGIWNWIWRAFG